MIEGAFLEVVVCLGTVLKAFKSEASGSLRRFQEIPLRFTGASRGLGGSV